MSFPGNPTDIIVAKNKKAKQLFVVVVARNRRLTISP